LQVSRNAGVNTFLLDGVALGGFGNTTPNTDVNSIALAMDHAYTRWPYLGTSGDFVIWNGLNFTGAQKTLLWQTFTGAASLNLATAPLMGIACQATGTTEPGTIEIYSAVSPWQKIASIAGGNGCNYGAMAPDGVHFWVPIQTDAAIKSFNLRTGNIDATVSGFTGGNTEGPIQIVFHPTLPLAYVASYLNDILWVVNTASLTIIETLTLPWNVDTISISPNGQYVYLNNQSALSNSGFVRVLSTSPYTMTQFNGGASRSEAAWLLPTLDENYLIGVYYALNVIDIFNASNLTLNTSFTLPSTYSTNFQALQTADGTKLYISGGDSGAGYVLSLNMESMPTLTLNAAIPFPNATYPSGITLSYDSRYLFVADFANNSLPNSGLVIIDTTTDEVVETLTSLTLWGPVNPGVTPNMVPNRLLVNQGMTGGAA
jgi:6-phosphogluconolactonase (cycloisomerase 2 family)